MTTGRRRPAVFLDRDGTLNREVHYLRRVSDLRLLPGTAAAIGALTGAGFAVVVVTNQSGVARGLIAPTTLATIHLEIERRLARRRARLAGIYFCPHHPSVGRPPLRRRCRCRKPAPGLVERACRDLGLDVARSYCVGDSAADLGLAHATGTRAVLVRTGHGRATEAALPLDVPVAHVAANFRAAAEWIIEDARRARGAAVMRRRPAPKRPGARPAAAPGPKRPRPRR